MVCVHQHLGARFRCRIRASRDKSVSFPAPAIADVAVDLIRADLEEALMPMAAGRFQ
jgi:hypothetical protein